MSDISQWALTETGNNTGSSPDHPIEGMPPSAVNDVMREMQAAIARWYSDSDGTLVTAGSSNAYTLTTNNGHAALADQPLLVFRLDRANTAAATLNVDGLGAKSMRSNGTAVTSGMLVANAIVAAAYNATDDAYDVIGGLANVTTSGSFTATLTGFSTTVTGTVTYRVIGGVVTLTFPSFSTEDLSNASTMTMTGMPTAIRPSADRLVPIPLLNDANAPYSFQPGYMRINSDGTATFLVFFDPFFSSVAFIATGTGTKSPVSGSVVTYPL